MSATSTQAAPADTWTADTGNSAVGFVVGYLAGTIQGSFSDFDAVYNDGALRGAARVASVCVAHPTVGSYLRSADFLDAERYPEIIFESTDVHRDGDRLTIDGRLTMKGRTEPIEIVGAITERTADGTGQDGMRIKFETKLDRKKFGISWKNPLPSGDQALASEVTLIADLHMFNRA